MEYGAIVALLVGACFGIFLAARHFLRLRMPPWVAVAHGVAGATGFGLLVVAVLGRPTFSLGRVALAILVFAVVMGCVNVVFHIRGIRHKSALIIGHAFLAVSGVTTLVTAIFLGPSEVVPSIVAHASASSAVASADPVGARVAVESDGPRDARSAPVVESEPTTTVTVITFSRASGTLDAAAESQVERMAERLKSEPTSTRYVIRGHADARGPRYVNARLARRRAWAVYLGLVARGIDAERLRVAGLGASCPSDAACRSGGDEARCATEQARERDRRVSLAAIPAGASRRWLRSCAEH